MAAAEVPEPVDNGHSRSVRKLKRHWTVINESSEDGDSASSEGAAVQAPPSGGSKKAALVPGLPLHRTSLMDPPKQPPRRKRAALTNDVGLGRRGSGSSGGTAAATASSAAPSPRLLTPRISWSEIGRSQESLDDDSHSQELADPRPGFQTPPRGVQGTPPRMVRANSSNEMLVCTPSVVRRPAFSPQRGAPRRRRPQSDDEENTSGCDGVEGRFAREFCEVTAIGSGHFSTVYRAKHRIDQRFYAVKKTTRIAQSVHHLNNNSSQLRLREVFALAAIAIEAANCPHIVRYFSSWLEGGRLHIQTELCDCSLRDVLVVRRPKTEGGNCGLSAAEIAEVLAHVASGLAVLHSKGYVHLDVKPDNILVSRKHGLAEDVQGTGNVCYKIADLGLAAAALTMCCDDICEGDCRYLAREVLRGDLSNLPKADVFSLGLLIFELATNPKPLPCNGDDWHRLRDGEFDAGLLLALPETMVNMLRRMIHSSPAERPPCEAIAQHVTVRTDDGMEFYPKGTLEARTLEAERNRKLADDYWHEILSMKRQELLGGGAGTRAAPSNVEGAAKSASASIGTHGPGTFTVGQRVTGMAGMVQPQVVTSALRRGYTA